MARQYVSIKQPRFRIELVDGVEQIRIRARRNYLTLLFLSVWLIGWTAGGVAAIVAVTNDPEPFLFAWLVGWALGWIGAAAIIGWQWTGSELIRVLHGDLELGYAVLGHSRWRAYRGGDVRNFGAAPVSVFHQFQPSVPFLPWFRSGAVKFNYGARTIYAGGGIDEAEGRMIVDRLLPRLPAYAAA